MKSYGAARIWRNNEHFFYRKGMIQFLNWATFHWKFKLKWREFMEKLFVGLIIVQTNLLKNTQGKLHRWAKLPELILIKCKKRSKTLVAFASGWISVAKCECCESCFRHARGLWEFPKCCCYFKAERKEFFFQYCSKINKFTCEHSFWQYNFTVKKKILFLIVFENCPLQPILSSCLANQLR